MVAVPPDTPSTEPPVPTEAIAPLLLLQVPPAEASERTIDAPWQNAELLVIPAGCALTVTTAVI